ncbi:TIM barrel protein [Prosthecochloris sp. SCSIO W1103]|uniref:TIM barrel protein n=1 Tax=Prosthecochloris sp. SCSIO W1103 TaxID=2992244 RepID=UPI00223CBB1C|nr:TIM barrel protein [Prosthecochloris sp. SCSIO W1103]UZJ36448.1 sugar phosphate isomerase/epimerase [Prosthecochloris sp. SCSIO W1103]
MRFLLNISTHANDLSIAGERWEHAVSLLDETGFDGYELYPVGDYVYDSIPGEIIGGIHLRFFVMLKQIWYNDRRQLLAMFDNERNIEMYYGGTSRETIVACYREQLELARRFNCPYVVFHPVHYELDYIFNWYPPWSWEEMVDLSADVINEVVRDTAYDGWILFENLWWPGNFRLDSVREIDRLFDRLEYSKPGLVLDTGHILNKNRFLAGEKEAVAYLLGEVDRLGSHRDLVKAVHLCKSLSGDYVRASMEMHEPFDGAETFWERFTVAARHVRRIDEHDAFSHASIAGLFERIAPDTTVFEFSFRSKEEWVDKIHRQKQSLGERFFTRKERS